MKRLVLFTNEFPYGNWEPYLETEIKYYDCFFDEVVIFALQLRKEHSHSVRKISEKIKVIPVYYTSRIIYFINSFVALFDRNLYKELFFLFKKNRLTPYNIVSLFIYLSRSHYEANKIFKKISKLELENSIFYSYRFEYQPYVALLLKKRLNIDIKIVARAHGYDLYEEERKNKYIPFRNILLQNIDRVYPVSKNGVEYLSEKYKEYKEKIALSFLGTADYGFSVPNIIEQEPFEIISCSNVIPVKRIDKIIEALSQIKKYKIRWTHYGDGILMKDIKNLSRDKLGKNIEVIFKGHVPNKELLEEYKKKFYHLFINTSSSEGIPVSIMEANSFGIPCIATDVGGTRELVQNKINGHLLEAEFEEKILSEKILEFIEMKQEEYINYRIRTRKFWNNNFNASLNYRKFLSSF
ncbi:glycosyltransferase [Fusobacterium necrophorum]|uniref:glycosyltransferase n=1 Tax=Fusobacterium necrophorum TaxID=859 RepID=UPI00088A943D|nr:glycosyltransferase [Fusobacterium necrophorum]AYZ73070.1 glycosyltransferase [Fusobacterium necrophorum]AZW08932.1 glycosyltransferase [Fusobacterium necrophorum subsp. necrophorum]SDB47995.1 Glycosyltransferase involved in cell wall bisynthesis [Fusobacterium necrophorum]SQD09909.1 colanic acid biosynthesis glycosyltransferase WcaL [Fusobacterium necrophorum subsp. necrophorum]